jgi:hypothetical protein
VKRAAAVLLALLLFNGSAEAQDDSASPSIQVPKLELQHVFAIQGLPGVHGVPGIQGSGRPQSDVAQVAQQRPRALVPLYVSFAALQGLDVHSTTRALRNGAVEANPLMKGLAGNPVALSAVKGAGAAGVIYASEKIWKKNKVAAVVFMVAANAGLAFVVQHNYRHARR